MREEVQGLGRQVPPPIQLPLCQASSLLGKAGTVSNSVTQNSAWPKGSAGEVTVMIITRTSSNSKRYHLLCTEALQRHYGTGTIIIFASLQKRKLSHRAATWRVSSRAGIYIQNPRDSRVLNLRPPRTAPPPSAPLYREMPHSTGLWKRWHLIRVLQ